MTYPPPAPASKPRNWKITAAKIVAGILAAWAVLAACDRLVFGADTHDATPAAEVAEVDRAAQREADRAAYNNTIALVDAELDCKTAVERALVAPTTAEYDGVDTREMPNGSIVTAGNVDSNNRAGVTVRSTFACTTIGNTTTLDYLE